MPDDPKNGKGNSVFYVDLMAPTPNTDWGVPGLGGAAFTSNDHGIIYGVDSPEALHALLQKGCQVVSFTWDLTPFDVHPPIQSVRFFPLQIVA